MEDCKVQEFIISHDGTQNAFWLSEGQGARGWERWLRLWIRSSACGPDHQASLRLAQEPAAGDPAKQAFKVLTDFNDLLLGYFLFWLGLWFAAQPIRIPLLS